MNRRQVLATSICLTLGIPLGTGGLLWAADLNKNRRYSTRPEVKRFIADVSKRRGLDPKWVANILDQASYQPKIERMMTPRKAPEGKRDSRRDWEKYRLIFIEPERIRRGLNFWQDNAETLKRAQKEFHVDPAVIVGIIGVETKYGGNTGNWKVLDSLVTLSFDYKRRADFFKKELEEFLVYLNNNGMAAREVLGSYAGAVGLPQFMPSSIKRFGVDYDGDGKIDLRNSNADAIGSIANYLASHGWIEGDPMLIEATITPEQHKKFASRVSAKHTWGALEKAGLKAHSNKNYPSDMKAFVVDFPFYLPDSLDSDQLYRAATQNFTAVLRYNPSYFYGGAVAELGSAVAALIGEPGLIDGADLDPMRQPIKETVTPITNSKSN